MKCDATLPACSSAALRLPQCRSAPHVSCQVFNMLFGDVQWTYSGLTLTYNRRAPPAEPRGNSRAWHELPSPAALLTGMSSKRPASLAATPLIRTRCRADLFPPVGPVPRRMPRAVGSKQRLLVACHLVYFTISARGSSRVRMLTALLERMSVMRMKMPSGARPYCQCSKSPWLSGALP